MPGPGAQGQGPEQPLPAGVHLGQHAGSAPSRISGWRRGKGVAVHLKGPMRANYCFASPEPHNDKLLGATTVW